MGKIKKYLPDILVIIGIGILSYGFYKPTGIAGLKARVSDALFHSVPIATYQLKILAIILIAIGLDIFIRRYLIKK